MNFHEQLSTSVSPAGPETHARHTSQELQWRRSQQLPWSLPISTLSGTGYQVKKLHSELPTQISWHSPTSRLCRSLIMFDSSSSQLWSVLNRSQSSGETVVDGLSVVVEFPISSLA